MHLVEQAVSGNLVLAWAVLLCAFAVLAKCADLFVDSAVRLAIAFRIPRLVIGIVLVSLATTAPELSVSLVAALRGNPEMALGNAIGSVICDDGLALPMVGLFAAAPVVILPKVLRTSAIFLIAVDALAFFFVFRDDTLGRGEGAVLLLLFVGYVSYLYREHRSGRLREDFTDVPADPQRVSPRRQAAVFVLGLAGIVAASEFIVVSATAIAHGFGLPEAVIALLLVALGTSIPEVATCITAARKGEGAVAVGNILGADILNVCWVAGASALANDLTLGRREVYFMFPAMFVMVGAMLLLLWRGYRLTRPKAAVLFVLYLLYIGLSFGVFPPRT